MASEGTFRAGEVQWGKTSVHYWTCGWQDAPWLVICHGGGLDHTSFRPLAHALVGSWRVLLWDIPGHGLSRPMPQPFSIEAAADALAAVMDDAGAPSGLLLGFSFGGTLAQVFTRRWPERCDGFIAYGCGFPQLIKIPAWTSIVARWMIGRGSWPAVKARFARMCSANPDVRHDVETSLENMGRADFLSMVDAALTFSDYDPGFRMPGPVLLIHGEIDANRHRLRRIYPLFRKAYPNAFHVEIPNAGHCAHQDQPPAFVTAITSFLVETARAADPSCETALGAPPSRFD